MLIFALALTAAQPGQLTEAQQLDIGCVAVLGLIAYDQQRKALGHDAYPDVQVRGKLWAGQVGDRITSETGLPKEVVALAISEAVNAEQAKAMSAVDASAYAIPRGQQCIARMDADLARQAADQPLPKPQ